MSKEIGPRERALREMREAKFDVQRKEAKALKTAKTAEALLERIAEASKKTGKSRKKKR